MSDPLLDLARDVAREAGAGLLAAFGQTVDVRTKSTPTDLVSQVDVDTEQLIRARLEAARPDDAVLGEEDDDRPGTTGLRWVVDPLDGTINYLFGIPAWCVSIACEDDAGTLLGVVLDPVRDELWAAERDGAASLNGTEFTAPGRSDLATALVGTGFGYDPAVRAVQAATVARLLPRVRDIRRIGSAAVDLAWTAAGRLDAFYERGLNRWDLAAGALICERAGLSVRELPPTPPARAGVLAAAPALADELEALLRE
jgi:myo-inositol-1(or 4)-monophosphatase